MRLQRFFESQQASHQTRHLLFAPYGLDCMLKTRKPFKFPVELELFQSFNKLVGNLDSLIAHLSETCQLGLILFTEVLVFILLEKRYPKLCDDVFQICCDQFDLVVDPPENPEKICIALPLVKAAWFQNQRIE